ncbi:MAG TPA: SusC/RagA family TonB-linked outer membrane protein [Flavitalea sp.]|nr:SusC/RagA family TonB-linked outer membrane protein [Flavitalea sp.]
MKKFFRYVVVILIVTVIPTLGFAQQRTVTGRITDGNNNPLSAVTILIDQSNSGTSTGPDGRFSLSAPENANLVISSTGYQSVTMDTRGGKNDFEIKLEEDVARLDEVLVTGLATSVKRRNQANAIVSISSKQLQGFAPAQTFDAALNGKIPGAYINASNGAPGGGLSVKLRGVTSIFGNTQPLYVVDGVFMDNKATSAGLNAVTSASAGQNSSNQDNPSNRIADLRFEDIENIEVLKGASAAAIYGSKAAAGVILITTKRGKQGATKINFTQDLGFVKVRKLIGVRPMAPEAVGMQGWDMNEYNAAVAAGKIYDYEKEMYGETGFTRNSAISLTGGSQKTSFYFSAATKDEEGIIKNTGYKNNSLRLNLDHNVNDNIKIGVSTSYTNSSADRGLTGNDNAGVTYGIALSSTPGFTELHPDANGVYPRNKYAGSNPLETRDKMRNNENVNRFVTGINLNALLQRSEKSLTRLIARAGIDFYNLQTDAQFPSTLQFQQVTKGTSIQGFTKNLNTNYIVSLVNEFTPSPDLAFTTSAGLTEETGSFNNLLNVATQVTSGQSNVDQAGAVNATQFRTKNQDNGLFLQEEAIIRDAISLTAGIRLDRSSNNGDVAKYYAYPKAGVSWNLTEMGLVGENIFENLKVRAAYGAAGNFPAYGSRFTSLLVSNIEGQPGSLAGTQQGQPGIKPERQTEIEAGLDFSVLRGKLNFEFTFYNKKVFDFLMLNTLPSSSGFTTQWVNAGDLRNRGVELGLNAQPLSGRDLRWNTSVNFWFNRSKVTRLTIPPVQLGGLAGLVAGVFQIEEGKSATQIIGLTNDPGVMPPIKVWGDQEPDFQMNTFNEFVFRNKLSLRFLIHWKNGGENINLTNLQSDFGGTSVDFDADKNGNHVPDGLDRIMKVGSTSEEFVRNSGYLKFREIGLYYSFDQLPVRVIKGLRIGVSLNNYFTITKYPSYDPEVSNFGAGFSGGVDAIPFPSSKRASFHLSVDL